jgi:FAD synthase
VTRFYSLSPEVTLQAAIITCKDSKIARVQRLLRLRGELKSDSLEALTVGIAEKCLHARAYFATLLPP